ncbi:hypothetical protein RFI_34503 [Reticulomyxa filosa]|uniref:Phosphatidate cytidylyltransferase n=1 Tax=Reticulomyxa filosa TaxID=46433 RepID=X6LMV0_RETFI|nr:hypothetical protein RFI_34503 [Reticulomyxa filosa]|eukprot:ETO02909.1 hypothetical protein RFI_34503 [Reticulomyxa filosa]
MLKQSPWIGNKKSAGLQREQENLQKKRKNFLETPLMESTLRRRNKGMNASKGDDKKSNASEEESLDEDTDEEKEAKKPPSKNKTCDWKKVCDTVCILQVLAFREIASLGAKPRIDAKLPNFYLLHWVILIGCLFYLYGQWLLTTLMAEHFINPLASYFQFLIHSHTFVCFCWLCIGIVMFVISLKPGFYRYQFKQLAWCLVTAFVVIALSSLTLWNLSDGMAWFLLPGFLIVTNDIFAYTVGSIFGQTRLIDLSPNKTWEGAIGGGICTIFMSVLLAYVFTQHEFFYCPKHDLSWSVPRCTPDSVFVPIQYDVPPSLASLLSHFHLESWRAWRLAPFQIHAVFFAMFASIIAPFGGFFASGFKRAFKIKDFGDSIPGHGGITDRMDCQILMAAFVYYYRKAFVYQYQRGTDQILEDILTLTEIEQRLIYDHLSSLFLS